MSTRPLLSLYALDRPALRTLAAELEAHLIADERDALAKTLGLGPELAARLATGPRAVNWFLRPESDKLAAPFFASLRRIAKKRALELVWTSKAPSLEGRLRAFELLREDPRVAKLVDRLLDSARLPWFLVRGTATGGWLDAEPRRELEAAFSELRAALPAELAAFADGVGMIDGAVVAHDGLV